MKENLNSEDFLDEIISKTIEEFANNFNANCSNYKYQQIIDESADKFIRRIYKTNESKKNNARKSYHYKCDINRNIMINLYINSLEQKGEKK